MKGLRDYAGTLYHDEQAFSRAHAFPFLVGEPSAKSRGRDVRYETIQGNSFDISHLTAEYSSPNAAVADECSQWVLLEVRRSSASIYANRIFVGRARTNDIVIPSAVVSKTHAYFAVEGPDYFVADTGSRNGTRVNSKQLLAQQRAPVVFGDVVAFGTLEYKFQPPSVIWALLRRFNVFAR